jgi:hypothetical protein
LYSSLPKPESDHTILCVYPHCWIGVEERCWRLQR